MKLAYSLKHTGFSSVLVYSVLKCKFFYSSQQIQWKGLISLQTWQTCCCCRIISVVSLQFRWSRYVKVNYPSAHHESIWGRGGTFHSFSTLAGCVCEWSASCSSCFTAEVELPISHVIGGFGWPHSQSGCFGEEKILFAPLEIVLPSGSAE